MTNRDKWGFQHSAARLLAASTVKQTHHQARLDWWTQKQEEVMAKVRAEGIEIDESQANVRMSASYNRGPSVTIRNDLVKDLQECVEKIREHRHKTDGYNAWVQVLGDAPADATYELNHADWLYFYSVPSAAAHFEDDDA